jgi:hypothetical protein
MLLDQVGVNELVCQRKVRNARIANGSTRVKWMSLAPGANGKTGSVLSPLP